MSVAISHDRGPAARVHDRRIALRLEYLTVGWNLAEGVIAIAAALTAESVVLMAFGLDSFVESTSGAILIWRLLAEAGSRTSADVERLDRRAHRLVGVSLFALAAFVGVHAAHSLWTREQPEPSVVGIVLTGVSVMVMLFLARAKRRVAARLQSRALEADAFQTTACWWLSLVALGGIALNAAFGWWWADPVAALLVVVLIVREAREAWRGDTCECH